MSCEVSSIIYITTLSCESMPMHVCRARKLLNLRLFEDPSSGKAWDKSVSDLGLEVLCVSQVGTLLLHKHPCTHPKLKLSPRLTTHTHTSSHCAMY